MRTRISIRSSHPTPPPPNRPPDTRTNSRLARGANPARSDRSATDNAQFGTASLGIHPNAYAYFDGLDDRDDVVGTSSSCGVAPKPGQTSIQAIGSYAARLLNLAQPSSRIWTTYQPFDNGHPVHLTPGLCDPGLALSASSWKRCGVAEAGAGELGEQPRQLVPLGRGQVFE